MDEIMIKTEEQPSEEILLFYVDENDGTVTQIHGAPEVDMQTVEGIPSFIIENDFQMTDNTETVTEEPTELSLVEQVQTKPAPQAVNKDRWAEEDVRKLLMFYADNKAHFDTGRSRKRHLWTLACRTMLVGKNPLSCENKLVSMKKKYANVLIDQRKGITVSNIPWSVLEQCQRAFEDDKEVELMVNAQDKGQFNIPVSNETVKDGGIVVVKKESAPRGVVDDKVIAMLNLYLKYAKGNNKEYWTKDTWEKIAGELGDDDADYWHKRFLNFKQHYIRLLDKQNESISWPYFKLFEQIYADDEEFQRKIGRKQVPIVNNVLNPTPKVFQWNDTEHTVLVKYYFDCYSEFKDPTIPDKFLWMEVGRLLDKKPEECKSKYEELKKAHLAKFIDDDYELRTRVPIAILFDNIISKEIEDKFAKLPRASSETWKTEELDELAQFLYDKIELFKDPLCYYVCWAAVSKKLNRNLQDCKKQWDELVLLYKSILESKKEDVDLQIDWRYIELFDRVFDYGTDTSLLNGYENINYVRSEPTKGSSLVGVKKLNVSFDDDVHLSEDEETYDDRGFMKRSKRQTGDPKAFKILEFYLKNKDKFGTWRKLSIWEEIAKDIGMSASHCAHRFRNLKQVYTGYIQREINKPEMPIMWPYYALCKKVFGYRALKTKLKNGKRFSDDSEEWTPKEIKTLIDYFGKNYEMINQAVDDKSNWTELSKEIHKSENACIDKFLEMRKCYRKLKTLKTKHSDNSVSWKYYAKIDAIFSPMENKGEEIIEETDGHTEPTMEVDVLEENDQEDDDFQCVIVIPEGGDINDLSNAQIISKENLQIVSEEQSKPALTKWTKKTKKRLLILYLNYLRSHRNKEIIASEMWKEIAEKLPNKTTLSCRKIMAKLKKNHLEFVGDEAKKKSPYYTLLESILKLKPKFAKKSQMTLQEDKNCQDVPLSTKKVEEALKYYSDHVEEFASPKFDNKYLWTELAESIGEPTTSVYNKVNYLKENFDMNTQEVAGGKTPFSDILVEIISKENYYKSVLDETKQTLEHPNEDIWTDTETEQLLIWYLGNLEKFKNPKYVRSYLWVEASNILMKSPLNCSQKMSAIRTQYRTMVKENPDALNTWRFLDLCQKIYGTGKKEKANN